MDSDDKAAVWGIGLFLFFIVGVPVCAAMASSIWGGTCS